MKLGTEIPPLVSTLLKYMETLFPNSNLPRPEEKTVCRFCTRQGMELRAIIDKNCHVDVHTRISISLVVCASHQPCPLQDTTL